MSCASGLRRGPGHRAAATFGGGRVLVGTSVPPKLAVCGAAELLTKVTWSPAFTFVRRGRERQHVGVRRSRRPSRRCRWWSRRRSSVDFGLVLRSFALAASPSLRYLRLLLVARLRDLLLRVLRVVGDGDRSRPCSGAARSSRCTCRSWRTTSRTSHRGRRPRREHARVHERGAVVGTRRRASARTGSGRSRCSAAPWCPAART